MTWRSSIRRRRRALQQARSLLVDLQALAVDPLDTGRSSITELGRAMLRLPVHPRLAGWSPWSGRCSPASSPASWTSATSCAAAPTTCLPTSACGSPSSPAGTATTPPTGERCGASATGQLDLARRADVDDVFDSIDVDESGRALLLAYPDRVAGRRRAGQFQLRAGGAAWLPDDDSLAAEPFIVAADLDGRGDRSRIRLAAAVAAEDVITAFGADVVEQRDAGVGRRSRRPGRRGRAPARRHPTRADHRAAGTRRRRRSRRCSGVSSAAAWPILALDRPAPTRCASASGSCTGRPAIRGRTGRRRPCSTRSTSGSPRTCRERRAGPTSSASTSPWCSARSCRGRWGPTSTSSPRHASTCRPGARCRSTTRASSPSAAVRVQDLFGVTVHPRGGGAPVVLHLLSPADRPIQVTSDLPGFWAGSWSDVRKDLAGRYPKHQWPIDPATATPKRLKDR